MRWSHTQPRTQYSNRLTEPGFSEASSYDDRHQDLKRVARPEGEILQHTRVQFDFLRKSCAGFDSGNEAEGARIATSLRILLHQAGRSNALLDQCEVLDRLWLYDSVGQYAMIGASSSLPFAGVEYTITPGKALDRVRYSPNLGRATRHQPSPQFQIRELLKGRKAPRGAGLHLRMPAWWMQPVMRDTEGWEFSRQRLVLSLSNTDGGAHVDPSLPEDYFALSRLNSAAVHAGMGRATPSPSTDDGLEAAYSHQMALSVGDVPSKDYLDENQIEYLALGSPVPASVRQIAWEVIRSVEQQFPKLLEPPHEAL